MGARQRFIVTSPGYTATKWLAWALNEHPDIHCTHSAGVHPTDHDYSLAELNTLVEEKFGARDDTPLEAFLARLEAEAPEAHVVGNVHRYNLTALSRNRERFSGERAVRVVNLVRHPVDWVASGTAQMTRMSEGVERIRDQIARHHEVHRALHEELGMPQEAMPEDLAFAYLCHRLCLLAREARMQGVRHVPMEAMTSDRDTFSSVVKAVSGREAEEAYLDVVFQKGTIHAHRGGPGLPSQETYDAWPPWRQRLFTHWACASGVFALYRTLGYAGWAPPEVADDGELARGCLEAAFWPVLGEEALMEGQFSVLFSRDRRRLHAELGGSTTLASGWGEGPFGVVSPGLNGGVGPLPPEELFSANSMTHAVVHPHKQDRSPALLRHDAATGDFAVLNLKGAGLRCPEDTFIARAGRCPAFVERLQERESRPMELLFDHPDEEYNAHRLVGGAEEGAMLYEAWHALGWHGLLLGLDGQPGALPVPISVTRLVEVATPAKGGSVQEAWEYFTDPSCTDAEQMECLLRDVRWVDAGFNPFSMLERSLALRKLRRGEGVASLSEGVRRNMGELYLRFRGPVVYAHASRAKLRIGHVWDQIQSTSDLEKRIKELGLPAGDAGIGEWIRRVLREIHVSNGVPFQPLEGRGSSLHTLEGRMACLRESHALNGESGSALLGSAGAAAGRTLGALHGAGGHGLGRRLKLKDKDGEFVRDPWGMVARAGAPGGGPTAPRNVTVAGEFMDLSMVSNPAMDWTSRFARAWSHLDASRCQPGHPRLVRRYQRCDLELAEEAMTTLSAFITGDEGLVDARWEEIADVRKARKRLEDGVRLPGLSVAEREERITEVESLEDEIRVLRDGVEAFPPNGALDSFRCAYEETFEAAARTYPRFAQENPREAVEETDEIH